MAAQALIADRAPRCGIVGAAMEFDDEIADIRTNDESDAHCRPASSSLTLQ
ncbi:MULTISPECIES: hypothetical protein [Xanthomonas]|uniref:hypothetical protein n=1 Tax=Xanthomonas TaxID=338 RepID=UPI001379A6A3|nr:MULTISPECIES: hypothetical protein [Xanthomonas]